MAPERSSQSVARARTWWKDETLARDAGYNVVAGVDEAGRGPLAGPVVAACVVLPFGVTPDYVEDSKALSEAVRQRAFEAITESGAAIGIGAASAAEVDRHNILRATHLAMRRAVEQCPRQPDYLLVDGLPVPSLRIAHRAIVRGDATCISIAAASVVAKVTRDRMMCELDQRYPGYGFARHKGYPTSEHLRALSVTGPCPEHRRTFGPVRALLAATEATGPNERPGLLPVHPDLRKGEAGERLAQLLLERLGHQILATGYRAGRCEIDMISRDGDTIVFTEVKSSRAGPESSPASRVSAAQMRRIAEAAERYLADNNLGSSPCRFDVIEVILRRRTPELRHYPDAFVAEGAGGP